MSIKTKTWQKLEMHSNRAKTPWTSLWSSLESWHEFGEQMLSIFYVKIIAAISSLYSSRRLVREGIFFHRKWVWCPEQETHFLSGYNLVFLRWNKACSHKRFKISEFTASAYTLKPFGLIWAHGQVNVHAHVPGPTGHAHLHEPVQVYPQWTLPVST